MATTGQEIKRTNPNAMVFIYNYRDRMGDAPAASSIDTFDVDQIILNTTSLLNVTTSKGKSNPAGTFEFRLAPTKNWVTAITPGSWCIILMSNSAIDDKAKYGGGRVDEKSFKMLGRIESVRAAIEVDQTTAARNTQFVVQGADWGTIFNSRFYVDPINRSGSEDPVGVAERFGFEEYIKKAVAFESSKTGTTANKTSPSAKTPENDNAKKPVDNTVDFVKNGANTPLNTSPADTAGGEVKETILKLPSAADSVDFILKFWGRSDPATAAGSKETGLLLKSQQQFKLPEKAAQYMQFKDSAGRQSDAISQLLHQITGKLTGDDKYSNVDSSAGIINFDTILGDHTIWQVLSDNNNGPINEMYPEIRFENGKAKLAIYNRVRPFTVNSNNHVLRDRKEVGDGGIAGADIGSNSISGDIAKDFLSDFTKVRKKRIDLNDIISVNYGTNWRDKYNFIEVNIDRSLYKESFSKDVKLNSQFKDADSIGRDGLQSMMTSFSYVPTKAGVQNPLSSFVYKYPLKEWYFNTHKMLNGTIQVIGQDQYIQIGDNIIFKAEGFGPAKNISSAQKESRRFTYILAHVESVSHTAQVDPNGARSFVTSINFVRGLISDVNGKVVSTVGNAGAVDQDAAKVTPSVEKNTGTLGTSSTKDPDRQKLRGK